MGNHAARAINKSWPNYFYCNRFFLGAPAALEGISRRGGNVLVCWWQAQMRDSSLRRSTWLTCDDPLRLGRQVAEQLAEDLPHLLRGQRPCFPCRVNLFRRGVTGWFERTSAVLGGDVSDV